MREREETRKREGEGRREGWRDEWQSLDRSMLTRGRRRSILTFAVLQKGQRLPRLLPFPQAVSHAAGKGAGEVATAIITTPKRD